MEHFINIANVLYLLSYFVRNMLWLRVFTVVGASCLIPYFYYQPQPLLGAICWNLFFIALNGFWIVRLILKTRADRTPLAVPVGLPAARADRITLAVPFLAHQVEFYHTQDSPRTHIRRQTPVGAHSQVLPTRSHLSRNLDTIPRPALTVSHC
jgi:hypothetical protein